ncbi:MAG: HAMP domain-containing protein, partial [Magnetococcales bacterium]|nr:HAMP domain-containing protein [Magnetococcales bacterium]
MGFTALIILLVSGALTSLSVIEHRDQMLDRYRVEAYQTLDTLTETILDDLYRLDLKELRRHLATMHKHPDIAVTIILDPSGLILVDGTEENSSRGKVPTESFLQSLLLVDRVTTRLEEGFLWIGAPVVIEGSKPLGWLALGISLEDLHHRLALHLRDQVGVAAGCVLLGLGLAFWLSVRFTGPITRLTRVTNRIHAGEDRLEVPILGRDEIRTLSLSLARMLAQIRASQHELRELNVSLDKKVAERTAELEDARRIAIEASQAKSDFLASMSHEIRTPMNAVIGLTELALQGSLAARTRDYLEKSLHAAQALLRIINDILDFSKIEAGRLELERREFVLRDVFDHVLDLFRTGLMEKRLELILNIGPECRLAMIGDAMRLEQVLMNLIANAIKFTDAGEIEIRVRVQEERSDQVILCFSIRDTGIGLSADQCARLFVPFSQADGSISRKYGGTGLGLVICRRLTEMMGGRIWVESRPGGGAVFSFTMAFEPAPGREVEDMRLPDGLSGGAVLVVDDNPGTLEALEVMLTGMNFSVTLAASGVEALARLEQAQSQGAAPFCLLLADWWMADL